jgi:hypothetical protein
VCRARTQRGGSCSQSTRNSSRAQTGDTRSRSDRLHPYLEFIHSNLTTGHSGYHKTIHPAKANFYWKGMRNDIKRFVKKCRICQENKHETVLPTGLLQPLPILTRVWSNISMDFIEGLPISHGFSIILVVVD